MRTAEAPIRPALFLLPGAMLLCGCIQSTTDISDRHSFVDFSFQGLQPLEGEVIYQAWAVTNRFGPYQGAPFLAFNVNEGGELLDPVQDTVIQGPFPVRLARQDLYGIAVSLGLSEADTESQSFLLGGVVENGAVSLELAPWLGLNMDLSGMTGTYVLATPTGAGGGDGLAGIWFMDPSGPSTSPGLDLPDAESGWEYEGWVVMGHDTLSTGKFSATNGADASSRFSGGGVAPDFPGEDFLVDPPADVVFPLHLAGAKVLVTLEPWDYWDRFPGSPFFLRLLEADIPVSAVSGQPYPLRSLFDRLPRGTALLRRGPK